jgi:signal transduction histidine kinase
MTFSVTDLVEHVSTAIHRSDRHSAALCLFGSAILALLTCVSFQVHALPSVAALLYMVVIVLVSLQGRFIPAIFVSIVAICCLDYFFIEPVFRLSKAATLNVVALVAYLTTALVVTGLLSGVRKSFQEIRALLAKTARQSAVLNEHNRLAEEIHDSLAQSFAGISMQLFAAQEAIRTNDDNGVGYVERANDLARSGLAQARSSALSLRSNIIEELGLIDALQMLVELANIPGRLRCDFRSNGVRPGSLPSHIQQHFLRIAQEGISYALRRGKPTVVGVSLLMDSSNLMLEITDNGSGNEDLGPEIGEGWGLGNMRERAKNLGAELDIRTAAGRGTSIIVRLPINW